MFTVVFIRIDIIGLLSAPAFVELVIRLARTRMAGAASGTSPAMRLSVRLRLFLAELRCA
jgi:hypothetical protein